MRNIPAEYDVAIIGAGIVGASSALWMQPEHKRVLLLDHQSPGSGASSGNACTLATYGCIPLNSPGIFRRLPGLMLSKDSPLHIDWRYALSHLPWQMAFLRNCTAQRVDRISAHLARLLALTDAGFDPLIERCAAVGFIADRRGCIYIFGSKKGFEAAQADTETRRRYGADIIELSSDEFRDLEPNIRMRVYRALSFHNTRFLRDPQGLVQAFVQQFVKDGGEFRQAGVSRVVPNTDDVSVVLDNGSAITCRKLVIAAGAWSRSIIGSGAEDLPLDTERGYHILFKDHGDLIKQPVAWIEGGFYATPMGQGLRLAGTVELAGLNPQPTRERIDFLSRKAQQMFGDIGRPGDSWLGFRPTFPDSVPVIGPSHRSPRIIFAFGHQHIGMTLGAATGMLVSELAASRTPSVDLTPYSANRFVRKN
jgi:glycine/D-amino acid oxidase-like deaminating enzyme